MFQLTFWSIPPLIAALVSVGAYVRLPRSSNIPGVNGLKLLLAAVLFWSGAEFLESLFTELESKVLIAKIRYCAIVITPVAWFVFALTYTRRQLRPRLTTLNLIGFIPLVTVLLVMTNDWHHLIWSEVWLTRERGYVGLMIEHNSAFYLHAAYSYFLIVVATSILVFKLSESANNLKPVLAVFSAPLMVGLANLFALSPFNPMPWFDLTSLGFAAACLTLNNGVLRSGLLDTLPIVRDHVVEQLREGIIAIDSAGRVIDVNPSALEILQVTRNDAIATPIDDLVKTMPLANLNARQRSSVEITIDGKGYDISSTILDPTNPQAAKVFVFRDVTTRRQQAQRLVSLKSELELLAHTDGLTALHNRRYFIQRLQEETERVRRHGSILSVLVFDLDHFKHINDTYGHEMGDRVLVAVAKIATKIKRITDVVSRIGGEEFALLLPETQSKGAQHLADRLRISIENIQLRDKNGTLVCVTASIGVATVTQQSRDVESVLNLADKALYQAKNNGRNTVCLAAAS